MVAPFTRCLGPQRGRRVLSLRAATSFRSEMRQLSNSSRATGAWEAKVRPFATAQGIPAVLLDVALGLGLVFVFILIAAHDLALPGIYPDETIQITPLLPVPGHYPHILLNGMPETQLSIEGRPFPLMDMRYIGSLRTILFFPAAAVFGISVQSMRLFTIGIAALVVAATYAFTAPAFSRWAAVVSA